MSALDRADSPTRVKALARGLELVTGQRTERLIKGFEIGTFSTSLSNEDLKYFRANPALYGYSNYSGVSVTPDRALESAAFYAGTKILAEDVGRLPMFLYRREGDTVQKAIDHPLFPLLHDLPNPDMNASAFWECMIAQAVLCSEGCAQIDRDSKGNVIYLWPMNNGPVKRDKNKYGRPFFIYKNGNSPEKTFEASQVFNIPGFSMNGLAGDDMVRRARQMLGLTLVTQEYPARFFSQDASPGVILTRPPGAEPWTDSKVAAIKAAWKLWHQGRERAHEPAVLQDGLVASRLDPDHTKLQLVEQRKFQVIEICRILRLSPHMLADLDKATFSNIEQLYNQHLTLTLGPWLKRARQSVYRCLLTEQERLTYYAEHSVEDFQRGLFLNQAQGFAMLLEKGVYTINEVRRWFNMNPVDGGDRNWIQLNMQAVTDAATSNAADAQAAVKLLPSAVSQHIHYVN